MTVPSSPNDRQKLKSMLVEGTHALQRIDDEREALKDIVSTISEEFEIEKKVLNKLVRTMYKRNYETLQAENEDFETLWETLMENKNND